MTKLKISSVNKKGWSERENKSGVFIYPDTNDNIYSEQNTILVDTLDKHNDELDKCRIVIKSKDSREWQGDFDTLIDTLKPNVQNKTWLDMSVMEIIEEYKDGDSEPLDGDSVDDLMKIIKAKINLQEGNITQVEYDKILG